jgi:hypothetical protein
MLKTLAILIGLTKVKITTPPGIKKMRKMKMNKLIWVMGWVCKSHTMPTSVTTIMAIPVQPADKTQPRKAEIPVRPKKWGALDKTH